MGAHLGQASIPMCANLRQDRMTALQKPLNGVRGILVRDAKLVARRMAQQLKQASPHCAKSKKAGTKCMAHVFVLTEADTHDGVNWSGSDSASKNAILDVLMTMARSPCLEGMSFYGQSSTYQWWHGRMGSVKSTSPIIVRLWANMRL